MLLFTGRCCAHWHSSIRRYIGLLDDLQMQPSCNRFTGLILRDSLTLHSSSEANAQLLSVACCSNCQNTFDSQGHLSKTV